METKTANLADAKRFADAIHAEFPDRMLAYNLSPSFNWDTTGMSEDEMKRFPEELGMLGYVFNFITYGGHQIDGRATEVFATALSQEGMLALARLQVSSGGTGRHLRFQLHRSVQANRIFAQGLCRGRPVLASRLRPSGSGAPPGRPQGGGPLSPLGERVGVRGCARKARASSP